MLGNTNVFLPKSQLLGRAYIAAARVVQGEHYKKLTNDNAGLTFRTNAEADGEILEKVAAPD
jgi:hypothetical protein